MKTILVLFILAISLSSATFSQESKTRKEKRQAKHENMYQEIVSIIDSVNYTFDALKASPSGSGQIDLTTHTAYLTIINDSVDAYLPFFGRAFSTPYGGGDSGFEFNTVLTDYVVEKNTDKLNIIVTFLVKAQNDNYKCTLTVTSTESATLFISSNKRASISFNGNIATNP